MGAYCGKKGVMARGVVDRGLEHHHNSAMSDSFMQQALEQAKQALSKGEVPIGALLVDASGTVLSAQHNLVEKRKDPTAHAEMLVMAEARAKRGTPYLEDCTLYVTLEPCAMCAQAISWSRVGEVRFGAYDVKSGGTINGARVFDHCHFKPEVYGGIMEEECASFMQNFFKEKRK